MSIIDWSDPEEMLGLLADYVRDESLDEHGDPERAAFLRELSVALESLAGRADLPVQTLLGELRDLFDAQPAEFARDPALVHVHDCVQELSRIAVTKP